MINLVAAIRDPYFHLTIKLFTLVHRMIDTHVDSQQLSLQLAPCMVDTFLPEPQPVMDYTFVFAIMCEHFDTMMPAIHATYELWKKQPELAEFFLNSLEVQPNCDDANVAASFKRSKTISLQETLNNAAASRRISTCVKKEDISSFPAFSFFKDKPVLSTSEIVDDAPALTPTERLHRANSMIASIKRTMSSNGSNDIEALSPTQQLKRMGTMNSTKRVVVCEESEPAAPIVTSQLSIQRGSIVASNLPAASDVVVTPTFVNPKMTRRSSLSFDGNLDPQSDFLRPIKHHRESIAPSMRSIIPASGVVMNITSSGRVSQMTPRGISARSSFIEDSSNDELLHIASAIQKKFSENKRASVHVQAANSLPLPPSEPDRHSTTSCRIM